MKIVFAMKQQMLRALHIWILASAFGTLALADEESDTRRQLHLYFQGSDIYETNCLPCHGRTGKGDGEWAADWTKNRPRNFRSGIFKFRTTPMGFLPTDEDLKRTILSGISGTAMPSFKGHLSEDQLEAILTYLKSFSRDWRKEERHADPVELPEKPEWMRSADKSKTHIASGRTAFATHCAACHGFEGKGDGPAAITLKDVWLFDIRPADLSAKHHKSGDSLEDLFRTISMGLDGTPMVGYRGVLKEGEIWDLVGFIQSLKSREP